MKGKFGGPMTVAEFYQKLYQSKAFFEQHGITHLKATYLYFTPCNQYGEPVVIADGIGNPVDGFKAPGYSCAADNYEQQDQLSPETTVSETLCTQSKPTFSL